MDILNLIISFIVPTTITLIAMYGVYFFFFRKEANFQRNRWYIVVSMVFSIVISFININVVVDAALNIKPVEQILLPNTILGETVQNSNMARSKLFSSLSIFAYLYLAGVLISLMLFLFRLVSLLTFIHKSTKDRKQGYVLVIMDKEINAFSFFNYLFINKTDYSSTECNQIITHEHEHIKQHHCVDLLISELVVILQWFNPFAYLFRKELKNVHEYIADKAVLRSGVAQNDYMKLILYQVTGMNFSLLGNSFSHKLTLKRIKMMKTKKSPWSVAKVAFALPIVAVLMAVFCVTARSGNSSAGRLDLSNGNDIINSSDIPAVSDTTIYKVCDELPSFPGGMEKMIKFLSDNIQYPESIKEKNIEGTVFASFVVEIDGSVSNVKIVRGLDTDCDAEVLRVVKIMPKWTPGKNDGEAVRVSFVIPVTFALSSTEQ